VHAAAIIIALMTEAVRTSETSVHYNMTKRRYIPEDSKLHTHRRENLKSHKRHKLILDLGTRWAVSGQRHAPAALYPW
jgi:hypothetical protein